MKALILATLVALFTVGTLAAPSSRQPSPATDRVSSLRITLLSTMLADEGFGEWGFAALVEVDGRRILFDTGANEDTVSRNLKAVGLDLKSVDRVVLSHNHADHTTGLMPLRREFSGQGGLQTLYAGRGIFWPRVSSDGRVDDRLGTLRRAGDRWIASLLRGRGALAWTAGQFKNFGVQQLLGAHCTGVEAVYRVRDLAGLTRQTCMVGAVGATYALDKGINPLRIAK